MATKTTYTQAPTWTAAQLATLFRTAFIDAGLMTEWYDSFLNTVENRVLEVTYNGAKAYGKTYYWFQFTTGGVFLQICTGWNATTKIPAGPGGTVAGTQYLDWYATTTNATTNHFQLVTLTATTQIDLIRYQSTASGRTGFAWFMIRNGATYANLHITPGGETLAPWIDLDKVMFHNLSSASTVATSNYATIDFVNRLSLRRSFWCGGALRGNVTLASYQANWVWSTQRYWVWGNANAAVANWVNSATVQFGVVLPTGFGNTNPAYSTNQTPIFHSLPHSLYVQSTLPSDFGVSGVFLASGMTPIDRLVVTPGTEEWEIVTVANNATVSNDTASPVFLARVV